MTVKKILLQISKRLRKKRQVTTENLPYLGKMNKSQPRFGKNEQVTGLIRVFSRIVT
jgi:hypothetical protein